MDRPIAYSGNKPYIFVSYAHVDNARVWPIIQNLQDRGFRVWYDNGIDPGTEWDKIIAEHLMECTLFLVVMSKGYLASDNCKDELSYSRDLNKNRVIIHLEEVVLPPELAMRIGRSQALFYYMYSQSNLGEFYENLKKATGMMSCYEQPVLVAPSPVPPLNPQPQVQPIPQPAPRVAPQPVSQPVSQTPAKKEKKPKRPPVFTPGKRPVFRKGIPGFRTLRPWKIILAVVGYNLIGFVGLTLLIGFRNDPAALHYFLPLSVMLYALCMIFVIVDFLNVNEIFPFAIYTKKSRAGAKILQCTIVQFVFTIIWTLLIVSAMFS